MFTAGLLVSGMLKAFSRYLLEQVNEFNKYLFIKHYLLYSVYRGRWVGLLYRDDVGVCACVCLYTFAGTCILTHVSLYALLASFIMVLVGG